MKVCRGECGLEKPYTDFWVSRKGRTGDGYMGVCKECAKARRRKWAAQNRDREQEWNRQKYQANPEYFKANAERWRTENPERHAELHRAAQSNRRARKRASFVESIDPQKVFERDGGICGICSEAVEGDYHIDHIIPLVKGGMHSYDNVQLSHPTCNLRKAAN